MDPIHPSKMLMHRNVKSIRCNGRKIAFCLSIKRTVSIFFHFVHTLTKITVISSKTLLANDHEDQKSFFHEIKRTIMRSKVIFFIRSKVPIIFPNFNQEIDSFRIFFHEIKIFLL